MFVGNNENARAGFEYFRRFHGVHQPLDGAIHHEARLLQCCNNRRKLLEYLAAFQAVNPGALSMLERDDREIMIATVHSLLLEEDRIQQWRKNPDAYSGAVTSSIFSIMKRDFAPAAERLRDELMVA